MTQIHPEFTPVINADVLALRPDYCAVSVIADGITNAVAHPAVCRYVEQAVKLPVRVPWFEAHLEAWRSTYRSFGAKPQRTLNSAEALLQRLGSDGRLPGINAVVDLYNAISVSHVIPVGGEDIAAYVGVPRLRRADGSEHFDTMKDGELVTEPVPAGEVVWADDRGVTCRRWNWRQGVRTRITTETRLAWFVLERLEPMPVAAAVEAAIVLKDVLQQVSPTAQVSVRLVDRTGTAAIA